MHFLMFFCILGVFLSGEFGILGGIPQEIAGNNTDQHHLSTFCVLLICSLPNEHQRSLFNSSRRRDPRNIFGKRVDPDKHNSYPVRVGIIKLGKYARHQFDSGAQIAGQILGTKK